MAKAIPSVAQLNSAIPIVPSELDIDEERRRLVRIKRAIRRKTGGAVQSLTVELRRDSLVIRGHCTSFYHKQVAQHAAMDHLQGRSLLNEIEVASKPR